MPISIRSELNDGARERMGHATGCEVRFCPRSLDSEVAVTLSAPEPTQVRVFWGSFQPTETDTIDSTPTTLTLSVPERLRDLKEGIATGRFDRTVCRILFDRSVPVALHDVVGDCRPPKAEELPDRRYLAYGTSITEGAKASSPHLNYVSQLARKRGYDALNLGASGSAYLDAAMADHIADRDDWDIATLALSVNMTTGEFSTQEFHQRAEYFVNTIADAHPQKQIVCVTLFPYFADITDTGDTDLANAFRAALRTVVSDSSQNNLSLVEGTDLLTGTGLTCDLLHPSDVGMNSITNGLSTHFAKALD
ncbi:SGNH/GDSL hydrolase family protein [Haloarcula japonica]|uniref:SGNH/GDSL hydrolase family protein n=1 Tax=Haloarcula japonica TaxID=29282 RepID=UPI0039F717E3